MSKLTKCKDGGHLVSKPAKTCPSCGVSKPAQRRSTIGEAFVLALVLFAGGWWIAESLDTIQSGTTSRPADSAPPTTIITDSQIRSAVSQSDDFGQFQSEFVAAARLLLSSRRCTLAELNEMGGFVKSQTHKDRPMYFTYCGGMTIGNRIYIDASSGEISK